MVKEILARTQTFMTKDRPFPKYVKCLSIGGNYKEKWLDRSKVETEVCFSEVKVKNLPSMYIGNLFSDQFTFLHKSCRLCC
jgi:hypothetical protein